GDEVGAEKRVASGSRKLGNTAPPSSSWSRVSTRTRLADSYTSTRLNRGYTTQTSSTPARKYSATLVRSSSARSLGLTTSTARFGTTSQGSEWVQGLSLGQR